jgi:hypothetical protein
VSHSLKDKFAADAMQAIITRCGIPAEPKDRANLAVLAYDIGEAMVTERARRFSAHSEKKPEAAE